MTNDPNDPNAPSQEDVLIALEWLEQCDVPHDVGSLDRVARFIRERFGVPSSLPVRLAGAMADECVMESFPRIAAMDARSIKRLLDYSMWLSTMAMKGRTLARFKVPCCGAMLADLLVTKGTTWGSFCQCPACGTMLFRKVNDREIVAMLTKLGGN